MSMPSSSASVATTASSSPDIEARLDVAALLGRIAGTVGSDAIGQVGRRQALQAHPREAEDQLDAAAAAQEADRPHALPHQVGDQLRRLGEDRAARHRLLVDDRRVPQRYPPAGPRGAVGVHELEGLPHQALGQLQGIGDRGRGEDEAGRGSVELGDPPQPPQHVGDVGAEHAPVGVSLVDHHPFEVGEEVAPLLVVRQQAHMDHVGIGEDEVRAPANRGRSSRGVSPS